MITADILNVTGDLKITKYILGGNLIIELVTANKKIQKMKYQILFVYKNIFNKIDIYLVLTSVSSSKLMHLKQMFLKEYCICTLISLLY